MHNITLSRVQELFDFNAATGHLSWKRKPGERAGGFDKKGYRVVMVDGTTYKEHRLIWLLAHGKLPCGPLDHINRNKSDNRLSNLRESNSSLNARNLPERGRKSEIGLLGVSRDKSTKGSYRAKIKVNGRQINLGSFRTAELAHAAYLSAKAIYH